MNFWASAINLLHFQSSQISLMATPSFLLSFEIYPSHSSNTQQSVGSTLNMYPESAIFTNFVSKSLAKGTILSHLNYCNSLSCFSAFPPAAYGPPALRHLIKNLIRSS